MLLSCLFLHYAAAFHRFTQVIKASFRSSRFFSLKMLWDRNTNKCFDKDITEYLGLQTVSAPARIKPVLLDTRLLALTTEQKIHIYNTLYYNKNSKWLVKTSNLESIFCIKDCHSQIAQVEHQGQTDQWRIERLTKAMKAALVSNSFSPIP